MMQRPFLRDSVFYLAAVYFVFWVFYHKVVHLGHAIGFIALYVVYVLVVIVGRLLNSRISKRKQTHLQFFVKQITLHSNLYSNSRFFLFSERNTSINSASIDNIETSDERLGASSDEVDGNPPLVANDESSAPVPNTLTESTNEEDQTVASNDTAPEPSDESMPFEDDTLQLIPPSSSSSSNCETSGMNDVLNF